MPPRSFVLAGVALALIPPPYTLWALLVWLTVGYALWPPRYWQWPLTVGAGLLVWVGLQNVLPFVGEPLWLNTITSVGLEAPKTISVSPAVSWLQFWPMLGGFLIVWWFLGQPYNKDHTKYTLRPLLIVLGIATAIAAVCLLAGITHPTYPKIGFFSYFANRNQSATLYAITTVCALGMFFFEHKTKWKAIAIIVMVIGLIALSMNPSRGGWVSLGLGSIVVLWHTKNRFLLITLAMVAMVSIVLVFSPKAVTRQATSNKKEIRLAYAQYALEMAKDNPLGVGLGNFRYKFGHYQKTTPQDTIAVHPENDWLWILAELGWPAILLLVAIGGFRLDRKNRRFPIVAGITAAIIIPSLFDVPLHRLGMLLPLLAVVAPTLKSSMRINIRPLRVLAIVPLVVLICAYNYHKGFAKVSTRYEAALETSNVELIQKTFEQAQKLRPYDFNIYQNIARVYLYDRYDPRKAKMYNYQALATHPKLPLLAQSIAYDWRGFDPNRSVAFWNESLRRADKEDRPTIFQTGVLMNFDKEQYDQIAQMCTDDPRLWGIFLSKEGTMKYLPRAIERGVDLTKLSCSNNLLPTWAKDSPQEALDYLQEHAPDSPYISQALANLGEYPQAVEHYLATHQLEDLQDRFDYMSIDELRLQVRLKGVERGSVYALALVKRANSAGDTQTVDELSAQLLALPQPPAAIIHFKAMQHITKEQWRAAWEIIKLD